MDYHAGHGAILMHLLTRGEDTAAEICKMTRPCGTCTSMQALAQLIAAGDVEGPDMFARYRLMPKAAVEITKARRHPLALMQAAAGRLQELLKAHAERLQIGGSIRRQKADCGDIELVAIANDGALAQALCAHAICILKTGSKYTQVIVVDQDVGPVVVDLFVTADPAQWGMLYFIRTGSADFVARALGHWRKISDLGYCHDLRLCTATGKKLDTPEEEDVFALLKCRFVEPRERVERIAQPAVEQRKEEA